MRFLGINILFTLSIKQKEVVKMRTEIIEKILNEASTNQEKKDINYKYELKIGEYPIKITMGVN